MAFRVREPKRRRIALMGLIDMIFILLVFFLIINVVGHVGYREQEIRVRAPKDEMGDAQVLIQIHEDGYVLMDKKAILRIAKRMPPVHGSALNNRVRTDLDKGRLRMDWNALEARISADVAEARDNNRDVMSGQIQGDMKIVYYLVRCPPFADYSEVVRIMELIDTEAQDDGLIGYGIMGGTLDALIEHATFVYDDRRDGVSISFEVGS